MNITKAWSDFKSICSIKNLRIQYEEYSSSYYIFATESEIVYDLFINKTDPVNSDQSDFEMNYKLNANKPIVNRTFDGSVKVVPDLRDDTRIVRISHDFCDKTSWWQNAVKIENEILIDNGDHLTYNSANIYWIDADMISDRNVIYTKQLLDTNLMQKNGFSMAFHKVWVNNILQVLDTDYTHDCVNGKITFLNALNVNDVVTASYYYATTATYKLSPPSGKKWRLYRTEIQFSKGVVIKPFRFRVRVANGAMIADERIYRDITDMLNHSNLCYNIPAPCNLIQDIIILPWDYETAVDIKSSLAMDIFVEMEGNTELSNCEVATVSFYMFEVAE